MRIAERTIECPKVRRAAANYLQEYIDMLHNEPQTNNWAERRARQNLPRCAWQTSQRRARKWNSKEGGNAR